MPDNRPEEQSKPNPTPANPSVPSPPLPTGIKPAAPKSAGNAPIPSPPIPSPPIPSPPLPPKAAPIPSPAIPQATPAPAEKHAEFKLTGDGSGAKTQPPAAPASEPTAKPAAANRTPALPRTPAAAPPPAAAGAAPAARKAPAPKAPSPSIPTPQVPHSGAPIGAGPGKPHPAPHANTHQDDSLPALDIGAQIRAWADKAEPAASLIFRIAGLGALLSLAFILYAIFIVKIGAGGVPATQLNLLRMATVVLHLSAVLMAITGILLSIEQKGLGIALVVGGLVLHFGAPWVLFGHVGRTGAVLALTAALRGTGMWLVYLGVLRGSVDLMQWIVELPDRKKQRADIGVGRRAEAAQQRVARDANVFSPCWQLPFCREVIRKQCPAFLAKKTCWKFGRGCYCDEEMISRIIKGESIELIKAPTRLSKTGKAPCGRCHIYLEHQGYKYKMLSPLALPITGIIMFLFWPHWTKLFQAFSSAKFWDAISFDKNKFTPDSISTTSVVDASAQVSQEQVAQIATILIGVLIGFFVLIYVCKFIEWFVYKLKF